ncbi:hypothetical protein RB594_006104 [Gaeumannomyces avenae]
MTTLKNRMIALGFNTSPMIISYVAGPVIVERSIGEAADMLTAEPSGRSWVEAYRHYWVQFDVVGLILITVGWAPLLLPFSLTKYVGGGWANGSLIAVLVMDPAILCALVAWECWWTPVPFSPRGYILNAFSLTSAALGVLVGVAIRWTGNVKWAAAAVAVPGPGHGPARALPQPGLAIAGGLWNKVLPAKLAELLSDEAKPDAAEIFGDTISQMAQGGAMRDAIITAYGQAQHLMVIAGYGFVPPVVSSLLLWRNMNVKPYVKELEAVRERRRRAGYG